MINSRLTTLCTATACLTLSLAANASTAETMSVDRPLDRAINTELNLRQSWNATLRIDSNPEQSIRVSIPIDNATYTLELEPHSIRADEYQVFMADDTGELYEVPAGPVRTLRGKIAELEGSLVSGSLMIDGLYARISLANGEEIWIEPVGQKLQGTASNVYAFYKTEDIIASGGTCAADDHMDVARVLQMQADYQESTNDRGTIICTAQLGCDTDYEYYQDWGSQTESRINSVINSVNNQYETQLNITHEITTVIIRSSAADPYTTTDAGTFLDQFRTEWNNNQGSVQRDVAHLFTGKNLASGTIGIAWLGVVCYNDLGYGLVESDCCGSFGCTTDLSAHELGHNWGAGHIESPSYNTMYPSIQCANTFVTSSINTITNFSNSLNCLTCANQAPAGACCISGSQCIQTYETNCDAGGGTWQGGGTTCATEDCSDPDGACCVDGVCYVYTASDCSSNGGSYAGDGSDCASTGCTEGACCIDTDCSITLQLDCAGSWYGDGTTCVDVSCGAGADQLNYELRTWSRSDGQAMETYDLYFPSTDPNTRLVSVFGENADFLQVRGLSNADFDGTATGVALHQSTFGSDLAHDRALDPILGDDLVYDSYVTIGSDNSVDGVPTLLGFDSVGFNDTTGAYMANGVWFVTPDDAIATIGAGTGTGHRALSASVEAGQGLDVQLSVQWFDGAGEVHENRNIVWDNLGLGGGGGNDCPTDIDDSGTTDVSDLLTMIGDWGACSGCVTDLDGNGVVDVSDLLQLIGAWGPCSEPETFDVTTSGSTFVPQNIVVRRGDTIVWTRGGGNHTVTSGDNCTYDGLFDAPLDSSDPVFIWVVPTDAPSTIDYYCDPHCSFGMIGEIIVTD
ncbi:MAG: plastocyanin [Phycisphaerales bacterium]|jgi:plastocyanin